MNLMTAPSIGPAELFDLKLLPAWVKEPGAKNRYNHYTPEEESSELRRRDRDSRRKDRRFSSSKRRAESQHARSKSDKRNRGRMPETSRRRRRHSDGAEDRHVRNRDAQSAPKPAEISTRFLPRQNVFENVVAQIKSGSVAYSVFALARLFLEKQGRYEVRLTAKLEAPLYQLGDGGTVSVDRQFLERNAFRFAQQIG